MKGYITWVCIAVLFSGCLSPYTGSPENTSGLPDDTTTIAVSDLFTTTGTEGSLMRMTRFYTNDPKYRSPQGYTLWTAGRGTVTTPFGSRSVYVRKPSGNSYAGYGLVLCEAPRSTGGTVERVFLTVLVNNLGQYAVGKVRGAAFEPLQWWTDSSKLNSGNGIENSISVQRDAENPNKYHLYFNNMMPEVTTFVDEGNPLCNGEGRNGYIVVIAPSDVDKSSVEVFFTE